jgi:hypothetical protein
MIWIKENPPDPVAEAGFCEIPVSASMWQISDTW